MCGKFTQSASWAELRPFPDALPQPTPNDPILISTPMRFATIVRLDAQGERETVQMRWGFAENSAPTPARPKHMHARCETIDTRPTFADSFRHRRGVLFVNTFNEGEELPNGKTKQWTITPNDGAPIAIAVIFEDWINGEERLTTFVQVTTPASPLIAPVTDRMPAILTVETIGAWLGETDASLADIKGLLQTFDDQGAWTIASQEPAGKKPKPAPPEQTELF